MEPIRLIHIAPELPPTIGGVADYTAILSHRLVEISDGAVEPVLVRAGAREGPEPEVDFSVVNLGGQCSAQALANTIVHPSKESEDPVAVLLEYSAYGYGTRGMPFWLACGLEEVCGLEGIPLLTMFHELHASGPPWSKNFWLSFPQAHVIRRIVRMSGTVITNRPDSASWLRRVSDSSVRLAPVFSNVGEPNETTPMEERDSYAVVFGGGGKDALYTAHLDRLVQFLHESKVQRLVDIGPSSEHADDKIGGIRVAKMGVAEPEVVSRCLRRAAFGFLCRNPVALTKSGGLAAYLSHGVPSVIALRDRSAPNPTLSNGTHYVSLERAIEVGSEWESSDWAALGIQGHDWYMENAHSRKAAWGVLKAIRGDDGV
ncbi:MAG: hypothetical protein BRD55_05580 [Bacteroidetes bacterium SW_9_63_38]|nr:MAG: hypothetical protein BRD55_05580 [Bacteroidetes bacterium SW_9_63_38]